MCKNLTVSQNSAAMHSMLKVLFMPAMGCMNGGQTRDRRSILYAAPLRAVLPMQLQWLTCHK